LSLLVIGIKSHWFCQIESIFSLIEFIMSMEGMLFKVGVEIFFVARLVECYESH